METLPSCPSTSQSCLTVPSSFLVQVIRFLYFLPSAFVNSSDVKIIWLPTRCPFNFKEAPALSTHNCSHSLVWVLKKLRLVPVYPALALVQFSRITQPSSSLRITLEPAGESPWELTTSHSPIQKSNALWFSEQQLQLLEVCAYNTAWNNNEKMNKNFRIKTTFSCWATHLKIHQFIFKRTQVF